MDSTFLGPLGGTVLDMWVTGRSAAGDTVSHHVQQMNTITTHHCFQAYLASVLGFPVRVHSVRTQVSITSVFRQPELANVLIRVNLNTIRSVSNLAG